MTPREREIINLIKKNPTISQQEIADALNIKRSSVAVHINNLSNQGYILGRSYILKEEPYVIIVGGANVDIMGYSNSKIIKNDSNLGRILESTGGVGRNIAENLSRLKLRTSLIAAIGEDNRGDFILRELKELGIETDNIFIFPEKRTSVYLAVLDENRDMDVAINDMGIVESLTPEVLSKKKNIIENAELCVLDTNLSKETLEFLLTNFKQKYFVDAVSIKKSDKIKNLLDRIYFLKANQYEAEYLSGIKIETMEDARKAAEELINRGLKSLVITMGEQGSIYADVRKMLEVKSEKMKIVNASGAGDAFMAGYVWAEFNDYSIKDRMKFATASSRIALMSEKTNSEYFTVNNIEKEIKNVK